MSCLSMRVKGLHFTHRLAPGTADIPTIFSKLKARFGGPFSLTQYRICCASIVVRFFINNHSPFTIVRNVKCMVNIIILLNGVEVFIASTRKSVLIFLSEKTGNLLVLFTLSLVRLRIPVQWGCNAGYVFIVARILGIKAKSSIDFLSGK